MEDSDSGDLDAKLRAWKVDPVVPGSFQHEVWQRIATRQAAREEAFWPLLLRWLSASCARPQYAMALGAVMLTSGLGLAHLQAQESNAKNWKLLEARYADSVNPLAMGR